MQCSKSNRREKDALTALGTFNESGSVCSFAKHFNFVFTVGTQPGHCYMGSVFTLQFFLFGLNLCVPDRVYYGLCSGHSVPFSCDFSFVREDINEGIGIEQVITANETKLIHSDGQGSF